MSANALAINQGFKSCVPYLGEMSEFLYVFLKQAAHEIDRHATGTTLKEVSGKEVPLIEFPLPPLAEQKRIVAKVDQLMGLCDELETKPDQSRSTAEALMNAMINNILER